MTALRLGTWRNGSASDSSPEDWGFKSLCPHFCKKIEANRNHLSFVRVSVGFCVSDWRFLMQGKHATSGTIHLFTNEINFVFRRQYTSLEEIVWLIFVAEHTNGYFFLKNNSVSA